MGTENQIKPICFFRESSYFLVKIGKITLTLPLLQTLYSNSKPKP